MCDRCHPSLSTSGSSGQVVISVAELEAMRARIRALEALVARASSRLGRFLTDVMGVPV